jgi:hypothetical protein
MLIVVALIGLMAGISFPSVTSGLDSLRLAQATDSIASFLNTALTRAERRQQVMEVTISPQENALWLQGAAPGVIRRLEMPDGVSIRRVFPPIPGLPEDALRTVLLLPGGTVPRAGVEIINRRGVRRLVRIDPLTGVPQIERPEETQ